MSSIIQFDLFEPIPTEAEMLKIELLTLRESQNKLRKGLFARHSHLAQMYLELHNRLEMLEKNISLGK